jgi:hypothetical protein
MDDLSTPTPFQTLAAWRSLIAAEGDTLRPVVLICDAGKTLRTFGENGMTFEAMDDYIRKAASAKDIKSWIAGMPEEVSSAPLIAGGYDLGEGWTLDIWSRYPEEESYWAHLTEADGSGMSGADDENTSVASAIIDVLLVADGEGAKFPASVAELLADFASRAAREIALSLAAPTTTSEEAPHAA